MTELKCETTIGAGQTALREIMLPKNCKITFISLQECEEIEWLSLQIDDKEREPRPDNQLSLNLLGVFGKPVVVNESITLGLRNKDQAMPQKVMIKILLKGDM